MDLENQPKELRVKKKLFNFKDVLIINYLCEY